MSNEKVREEFEAWYWINYQVKHSMSINEVLSRDSFDEYRLTIVSVAYDSWKASRAALCVELPKLEEPSGVIGIGFNVAKGMFIAKFMELGVRYK